MCSFTLQEADLLLKKELATQSLFFFPPSSYICHSLCREYSAAYSVKDAAGGVINVNAIATSRCLIRSFFMLVFIFLIDVLSNIEVLVQFPKANA